MTDESNDSESLAAVENVDRTPASANLTTGPIWRSILTMSYPLLISTVSNSVIGIADVQVAKYLGTFSQAAVGVGEQVLFLFEVIIISMGIGTTALISKAWGANKVSKAQILFVSSLAFSLFLGLILFLLQYIFGGSILQALGLNKSVIKIATHYLQTYCWFYIPFSFLVTLNASFRSIGDAKMQMMVVLTVTILNILFDYLLVALKFPLTYFGTNGIAYASILASSCGAVFGLFLFKNSKLYNLRFLNSQSVNFEYIKSIFRIGFPAAIHRMNWVISVFVLFYIFSACCHSTAAIAAWSIGIRIEALLFMPLVALSLSVSPIVGQSIGAKNYKRAYEATIKVTLVGVGLMLVASILMFLAANFLAQLSSLDQETIKYVTSYLKFNAVSEPLLAINMIITGALQGAGNTRYPMIVSIIANWVIRIPLAYILALKFGPIGVFIAMVVSTSFSAISIAVYFYRLNWLSKATSSLIKVNDLSG